MRLSVAMCTYNGEAFLDQQLESLARQHRLPDELVLADDGSTDRTLAIAETFAARAPFPVHILRNPVNLGYTRNFAQAVDRSTGDLIALADQDDLWYPHKLSALADLFAVHPDAGGVFSDGDLIDADSQPTGRFLWQSFRFGPADQARFRDGGALDALLRRNVVTGMAFAFRSTAKPLLRAAPPSWIHDGWLAILLAIQSRLIACPERLVGYRIHATQQVGTPLSPAGKLRHLATHGLRSYTARTLARNLDEYQRLATQFDDLYAYLQTRSTDAQILRRVAAKAAHAHRGAQALALPAPRRWPILLPHLAAYAHLSPTGLRAIPRDLFV